MNAYEGPTPTQAAAAALPNETPEQRTRRLSAGGLETLLNGMSMAEGDAGGGGGAPAPPSAAAQAVFGTQAPVESPYRQVLWDYFKKHNPSKVSRVGWVQVGEDGVRQRRGTQDRAWEAHNARFGLEFKWESHTPAEPSSCSL